MANEFQFGRPAHVVLTERLLWVANHQMKIADPDVINLIRATQKENIAHAVMFDPQPKANSANEQFLRSVKKIAAVGIYKGALLIARTYGIGAARLYVRYYLGTLEGMDA